MNKAVRLSIFFLIVLFYSCGESRVEAPDTQVTYKEEKKTDSDSCSKGDKDDCCKKLDKSDSSEITCPNCGHKKTEKLPTEVCQLFYKCEECGNEMHPKEGDCCVFCSYGDHKCPSKQ